MSVGKAVQDLNEEDVGMLAKTGYGQDGQAFDIIYPDAEKFPGLLGKNGVKYNLN
jgi:hypothetical protein